VTQLSCNDHSVASQESCFQYHTGITGTVQSYNYAGSFQLVGTNYKNCIRQEAGYCCIEYIPIAFKMGPIACAAAATRCASNSLCSEDYIIIPEGIHQGPPASFDRFCGTFISPGGISNVNAPVTTCKTPFELTHVTGTSALNFGAATVQVGYAFNYRQIPGNC